MKRKCTVHMLHSSSGYNHVVNGEDTKSLQSNLYQSQNNLAIESSASAQLERQCTNSSFSLLRSFLLTIVSLSLSLIHSLTHLYPVTPKHPFLNRPQHSDLAPICFSLVILLMRTRRPDHLIGLFRGILRKPLPPFMFIAKQVSSFHSVACMLHQTKHV